MVQNKELEDLKIPEEFKRQLSDILIDSPTIVDLGTKKMKIKGLRMYSIERMFKAAQRIKAFDQENIMEAMSLIYSDIDVMCEIVAIILCNHLFDEDNCHFDSFEEMCQIESRNDKLIKMMQMKARLNVNNSITDYANIIVTAFTSFDAAELFQLASSVTLYLESLSMRLKRNTEMLSTVQQAGLARCQTGSKRIRLGQKGTTSTSSPTQK